METITITKRKPHNDKVWYDFSNIPQERNYIQVGCLVYTSDRKAINQAKRINPNYTYKIEEDKSC